MDLNRHQKEANRRLTIDNWYREMVEKVRFASVHADELGLKKVDRNEFCAYCGKIYFNVNIKLLAEMPKIAKCLKCLKLRYSVDFNK